MGVSRSVDQWGGHQLWCNMYVNMLAIVCVPPLHEKSALSASAYMPSWPQPFLYRSLEDASVTIFAVMGGSVCGVCVEVGGRLGRFDDEDDVIVFGWNTCVK